MNKQQQLCTSRSEFMRRADFLAEFSEVYCRVQVSEEGVQGLSAEGESVPRVVKDCLVCTQGTGLSAEDFREDGPADRVHTSASETPDEDGGAPDEEGLEEGLW